jgi:hypothetical protein
MLRFPSSLSSHSAYLHAVQSYVGTAGAQRRTDEVVCLRRRFYTLNGYSLCRNNCIMKYRARKQNREARVWSDSLLAHTRNLGKVLLLEEKL